MKNNITPSSVMKMAMAFAFFLSGSLASAVDATPNRERGGGGERPPPYRPPAPGPAPRPPAPAPRPEPRPPAPAPRPEPRPPAPRPEPRPPAPRPEPRPPAPRPPAPRPPEPRPPAPRPPAPRPPEPRPPEPRPPYPRPPAPRPPEPRPPYPRPPAPRPPEPRPPYPRPPYPRPEPRPPVPPPYYNVCSGTYSGHYDNGTPMWITIEAYGSNSARFYLQIGSNGRVYDSYGYCNEYGNSADFEFNSDGYQYRGRIHDYYMDGHEVGGQGFRARR